ncbi:hypothetical protein QA601_00410 [Chitinispirillales bacterium ANBcel5]|uniref:hypothetical protein n=1 Tax=Cellulosispirillum alkaliphilum TaxID=3039283 RepID=UPI002A4F6B03|nr:hypothetical protein [Chitinispirillales bacterium ANBcel5]
MQLFDLYVTKIPTQKARLIVARMIATTSPSVPLHKAMELVLNLPVQVLVSRDKETLAKHAETLMKFEVKFRLYKSQLKAPEKGDAQAAQTEPAEESTVDDASSEDDAIKEVLTLQKDTPKEEEKKSPQKSSNALEQNSTQKKNHTFFVPRRLLGPEKKGDIDSPSNTKFLIFAFLFIVLLAFVTTQFGGRSTRFATNKSQTPSFNRQPSGGGHTSKGTSMSSVGTPLAGTPAGANQASRSEKKRSTAFVDSARSISRDHLKAINFYKIALSFNKNNINAWYGLINSYREAGMHQETRRTIADMEEHFGNSIYSASSLIEDYGSLLNFSVTDRGTYQVEYVTGRKGKEQLIKDAFHIVKGLRTICNSPNISLYVSTDSGSEMILHGDSTTSLNSLRRFREDATIIHLD